MELLLEGDDDSPNMFTLFALSKRRYSPENFILLNTEIAKDPMVTGEILASEKYRGLFLSDFSEIIQRIIIWLGYLQKPQAHTKSSTANEATVHNFASNFIAPLLDSSYEAYHTLSGFTDLLTVTTQLSYDYRRRGVGPKTHKTLLHKISNCPHLMRRILPSMDGANLIQTILAEAQAGAEIRSFGTVNTLQKWTEIAVELCCHCRGNHGVGEELKRWSSLLCLQKSIKSILEAQNKKRGGFPQLNLPPSGFDGMRVLSKDDKKSGVTTAQGAAPPSFSLSPADRENLALFNLKFPAGIGALESTVTWLEEKEAFRLYQALVKSFPCALCLRGEISRPAPGVPSNSFPLAVLPDSFTGILFGQKLGPWKINLSEKAFKDLQMSSKEGYLGNIARKLRELASGYWDLSSLRRPLSQKMLEEARETERVPLLRAVYGSSGRILWQVNVAFDEDEGKASQIVTVWRIGESDEVRKSIRYVLRLQKGYSKSHQTRCLVDRTTVPVIPVLYGDTEDICDNSTQQMDDHGTVEAAEAALLNNKFYSMSGKVLERLLAAPNAVEFPFDISMEETEIIKYSNTAAFILGRSGTGKTTCLLFKLLCRNIARRESGGTVRQIFLTRSSFLAERLRHYLQRLIESQLKSGSLPGGPTMSRTTLQEYTLTEGKDPLEGHTLDNMDNDMFPLVCTFDQLFGFLEKVIWLNDRKDFSIPRGGRSNAGSSKPVRRLIDYNVFSRQYWKQQNRQRHDTEPDLIFSEILGIIKGSTSVQRGFEPLSKEEYISLSQKKAPVFTSNESRAYVYRLYEEYERMKNSLGDQDDIDRVSYLMRCLETDQDLKKQVQSLFDEVYVDEIQDNKMLELDLLLTLVRNPHGIHFAGDTAQCISRDNTFRFADIKARFYEHFVAMAEKAGKPHWAKPELLTLAKNYRSHQGILALSADIVEMLYKGFPGQIDRLPREIGSHPGARPTVFLGFDHTILAQGGAGITGTEESITSFGAEQVIIVRNDTAKEALQESLKSTLILTVVQSKGLEFEDVILYGFFAHTLWDNLSLGAIQSLVGSDRDRVEKLQQKHGALCSELKYLYVAVTRARKNLWIVERNPDSAQHLVTLWTSTNNNGGKPLVSVVYADDPEGMAIARRTIKPGKSTNPEAWRSQGEILLHRALYPDALLCFRRAGHSQGILLAKAYLLYEEASALDLESGIQGGKSPKSLYIQAAQHFEGAGFIQKAAESWGSAGEYRKAAKLLQTHGEYGKAAAWYEKAGELLNAASSYQQAEMYDDAVRAYRQGEHFAELVMFMKTYQDHISKDVRVRYSTLVNLLLQRGDLQLPATVVPEVVGILGEGTAREEFYIKYEKTEDLMALYQEQERFYDAFKLAINTRKLDDAVRLGCLDQALNERHKGSIPVSEFLVLFNGLLMEYTWCLAKLRPANKPEIDVLRIFSDTDSYSGVQESRRGWEQIIHCMQNPVSGVKYGNLGRDGFCEKFFTEFGYAVLDFLELMNFDVNCHMIPQVTSLTQLPVTAMSRFAIIAGDLLAKKPPSASLLACAGALVFSHLPNQVMVFNWSPLRRAPTDPGQQLQTSFDEHIILPMEQVQHGFIKWLIPIVARVIPEVLRRVCTLFDRIESPCFFALQGICRNQPSECKEGRHTKLPSEEAKAHILSLLEAVGLSCASARLYYNRTFKESDSKDYLPLKRNLLEKLLKELTFISPWLNTSLVQQEVWDMIRAPDGKWLHVDDGLASLFFHRLKKRPEEWQKRGGFSALLEEWSFAIKLEIIPPFMRYLYWKARNWCNFFSDCNSLELPHIARLPATQLAEVVSRVTTEIMKWDAFGLRTFHSVLSLFESISLELINRTVPMDIVVASSRQQFIQEADNGYYPTDGEQLTLEYCLMQVLGRLCEILLYLAEEYKRRQTMQFPEPLFEACGSRLRNGNRYMIRRSLNHLALCMVNMGVERILPKGYGQLSLQISQVVAQWGFLVPSALVNWPIKPEQLAYKLLNEYRHYNKDELVIIPKSKAHPRFQFLGIRILLVQKKDIKAPSTTQKPAIQGASDAQDEEIAISKIVRWWRRCSEKLKKHRERAAQRAALLESGPRGYAEVMISDIVSCGLRPRYWHQRQILESSGVVLLEGIVKLLKNVELTHQRAMEGLTDTRGKYPLGSAAVEDLQDMIGNLQRRKSYLEKTKGMFCKQEEAQTLLDLHPDRLAKKMRTASETLEVYQQELEKWARETEDYLAGGLVY